MHQNYSRLLSVSFHVSVVIIKHYATMFFLTTFRLRGSSKKSRSFFASFSVINLHALTLIAL